MRRYPGNYTDSELLSVPRFLKTRPGAPQTHLAYITDSEANLLQENKPGTPHGGPHGIPNYDSYEYQTAKEEQQAYARETGQSTQQAASSLGTSYSAPSNVQEQQQEIEHDRQTQIQTNIRDEQQRKAQQKRDVINNQKMARAQKSQKLGAALKASGISLSEFNRMKRKGTLPPEVAAQLGLAEQKGGLWYDMEGNRYVPKEHGFSEEDYLGLEEQQFAYDEGVYGGVAGIEAEINKAKKRFAETGDRTHLERLGYDPGVIDQMDPWTKDESGKWIKNPGYNPSLGYDPTGVYTFSDIEDTARFGKNDPRNLYQSKYLQRGNLWDDPLSGTLAPQKNINYGGGGGGGGWGGYGGYGYGGGGGGGSSYGGPPKERPQFPGQPGERWGQQMPLQQAMINIHGGPGFQQGFARGGIVGLVT